jgi:uncharacterized protein (DUF736 family)
MVAVFGGFNKGAIEMAYDNELSGVLFKNDRKESPKHPDYQGNIQVKGVEYWLSAWIKEKKSGGGKFMSLSLKPKDGAAPAKKKDEDIPW